MIVINIYIIKNIHDVEVIRAKNSFDALYSSWIVVFSSILQHNFQFSNFLHPLAVVLSF